jgi:ribosomal-protein-alanine N-acetyltransferase
MIARGGSVTVGALGVDSLSAVDGISARAFDPRYGEAWNKAQCLAVLALPGYRLRGAWVGDPVQGLMGFCIDRTVAGESELLLLAVDPAARRQGVGAKLMTDWLGHARSQGVTRAFLEMREDNPARHLYDNFGFRPIAVRPAYYRGGDGILRDAVTMDCLIHQP